MTLQTFLKLFLTDHSNLFETFCKALLKTLDTLFSLTLGTMSPDTSNSEGLEFEGPGKEGSGGFGFL